MYHCHLHICLIGPEPRLWDPVRAAALPGQYTCTFAESETPFGALPDGAGLVLADLRGLAVLMVVAGGPYLELCGGENLCKLAVPASRADFCATLHLLMDLETASLRHPPSRRREEEQQVIRRAKELLMDVNRMSEAEAHRFLQKRSMDHCTKLVETAREIIDSYTIS